MEAPLVSIIIPVYNVEKFIAKCIDSVITQTYDNLEIIVVNDGSPDNSIDIVSEYTDPRIKIYHKKNGGLSDARNYGIDKSNGTYLYFLDSDDWVESDLIEKCVSFLENNPTFNFVVFGFFVDYLDEFDELVEVKKIFSEKYLEKNKSFSLTLDELNLLGYAWNKMYRSEIIKDNKLYFKKNISLVEDILFNVEIVKKSKGIPFIDDVYYHYVNRDRTTLVSKYYSNYFDLILLKFHSIKSFFECWDVSKSVKNDILSAVLINGFRSFLSNLIDNKKELTHLDIKKIECVLSNVYMEKYINYYKVRSVKDLIFFCLIKTKSIKSLVKLKKYGK